MKKRENYETFLPRNFHGIWQWYGGVLGKFRQPQYLQIASQAVTKHDNYVRMPDCLEKNEMILKIDTL